jgi:hypothetical protein
MYFYVSENGYGVGFKSIPRYFTKERAGLKPNTVRKLSVSEKMAFDQCRDEIDEVTVTNTDTKETFTRKVTDISTFALESPYNGDMHIISWEHEIFSG